MKKVIILGATGGCVDVLDTLNDVNARQPSFECLGFLDDKKDLWGHAVLGKVRVLGPFHSARDYPDDCFFATAIGSADNYWRRDSIIASLGLSKERFVTICHPTASISRNASVGLGCVVHPHVTITTNAVIGDHVVILPNSVIGHDSRIGDYTIVNAGVCVAGGVDVGPACYLGANSSIRQDVKIGERALIGMGSVVISDVAQRSVVAGSPAKFLRAISSDA